MKQTIVLQLLMIFVISIFSFFSISDTVYATYDQMNPSFESCYEDNYISRECDDLAIHETQSNIVSLKVTKKVLGGPASPNDFDLTVNGNLILSGQKNFYGVDTVLSIGETEQPDYIFSSITGIGCPTSLDESFTITQDTECIITNIFCLQPSFSLTVHKEVLGGPVSSNDFVLTVDGSPRISGQTSFHIPNTILTIDETQLPGYIFSSITGVGCPTNLNEPFTLTQDTICTITNTFSSPTTITVIKTIINDDGGSLTIAGVDLKLDGVSVTNGTANTVSTGKHTVSETAIPGYEATIGGDCDAGGSIAVALGENKTCTITNDDVGPLTLTVIKKVVNNNNGTATLDDFTLIVNGNSVISGQANSYAANTILSIDETHQSDYFFSSITGVGCPTQLNESFALTHNTVCTITNIFNVGSFLVSLKVILDDGDDTALPDDFVLTVDGSPRISGQISFHIVNTRLSIGNMLPPDYTFSIKGDDDCPKSLNESFTLTHNTVCTITISKLPVFPPTGSPVKWDTRPTFGVSHETRASQMVDNGFVFNGEAFQVTDNHYTPFKKIEIEIGTENTFKATVWAINKLKIQEFLFGIPQVGFGHLAEMRIEVWYDFDGEIEDVKIIQKTPVIDISRLTVSHEKTKCLNNDSEPKCDSTTIDAVFLEELKDTITALKAIDFTRRDQTTYLNDGFEIFGTSLNPMKTMEIPSTVKGEGLITVTQTAKYSPYWISEDGRVFEKNEYDSFKQIGYTFERFQDSGTAYTRQHSEFGRVMEYEQKRALKLFNATDLISKLSDSFSYDISIKERITDEVKDKMLDQEQIAQNFLERNSLQARW